MECVYGTKRAGLGRDELLAKASTYPSIWVDLGTGDGRYVTHLAKTLPDWLIVGVDACREPLREHSRKAAPNSLFAIANASRLPAELNGLADRVTINFPWGSLLSDLVGGAPELLEGLQRITQPQAQLDIRLNGSALTELQISSERAAETVQQVLCRAGWQCAEPTRLNARQVRELPTSWARRLVHGPHPWAVELIANLRK